MTQVASHAKDRAATALRLALCALALGLAIYLETYRELSAFLWLSVAVILSFAAMVVPTIGPGERVCAKVIPFVMAVGIVVQAALIGSEWGGDYRIELGIAAVAVLGILQIFKLGGLRMPLVIFMAAGICWVESHAFLKNLPHPNIDVFNFQQSAADALVHGNNPYSMRMRNSYDATQTQLFYGPGVVGPDNRLNFGFPYPPLSLLLVMPAYWFGGDVRFAMVVASAIAAVLMALARPGRWGALAAALFLLTPRGLFVMEVGWTEPLGALMFSVMMFCACRWRAGLPWAIGLFLCTKQYNILMLPLLGLLIEERVDWREIRGMLLKAGVVVVALNLPFFLWQPRDFVRATVIWQIIQPLRFDSLSYLPWICKQFHLLQAPLLATAVSVGLAICLAIFKGVRTPAGFAASLTLVNLAFFAMSKQAFPNYYYFVVCTCCWGVAATRVGDGDLVSGS